MKFTVKKATIDMLNTTAVQLMANHQEIFRVRDQLKLGRGIIAQEVGGVIHALSGGRQIYAYQVLQIPEAECFIFKGSPPLELLQLSDEFGRRDSHPVVESFCIRTLTEKYKFKLTGIARILDVSKQIVSDTKSISTLPKEVLDDALKHPKIPKRMLISLSRMKASDTQKLAAYHLAIYNRTAKSSSGCQLADITACIRKGAKAVEAFRKVAQTVQIQAPKEDLEDLENEFNHFVVSVGDILKKYDASYPQPEYFL